MADHILYRLNDLVTSYNTTSTDSEGENQNDSADVSQSESAAESQRETGPHLFSCPQTRTTLSALDLWRDPSGVAALLDDWREKLAAKPNKATET